MNAVRDKHDTNALPLQAANHRKQALAFVLVQRRGRFIEDKKAAVMRQRAGQQDLLFFRQRTAVDGAAYVEADVKLSQRPRASWRSRPQRKAIPGSASLSSMMFSAMLRPGTSATSTSCCTR